MSVVVGVVDGEDERAESQLGWPILSRQDRDDEGGRGLSGQVAGLSRVEWRGHGDGALDGIWSPSEGLRAGVAGGQAATRTRLLPQVEVGGQARSRDGSW